MPGWLAWKSTSSRGQDPGDQAGRGADREPSPRPCPLEGPGLGSGGLHVGQHPADERQQGLAVGGQGHRPWPGPRWKSEHAELALEQADLAAQRGLGQLQARGRPGEALLLGHGDATYAELVQLHRHRRIRAYCYVFDDDLCL